MARPVTGTHVIKQAMNPVRITALVFMAAGILTLVLDVMERLLSPSWNGMALGYLWSMMAPASLQATQRLIEGSISLVLWQHVLLPILMLPVWAPCLVIGVILFIVGKRLDD